MKEAMNHAIDVLKDSQDYKMGRAMTVEAVEELEEAVLNLDKKVVSLQCAHCQVTIDTLNDKVMSLLAKQSTKCVEQRSDSEQLGEPVAHINQNGVIHEAGYPWGANNTLEPLYRHLPQQRKPLTDEQIDALKPFADGYEHRDFARAIEAAHGIKEKNT
jgi:hypothetical protein